MQLHIPVPSSWSVSRRRGRQIAVIPGSDDPDLLLEWGAVEILPDEQKVWVRSTLRADIPPTAKVDVKSDDTRATVAGWPVRLVEASIVGSDGKLLERRLVAFYAFLEHGATAMFRGLSSARFDANLDKARELLHAAGPDWSGHISALTQLWDVTPTGETRSATPERAAQTAALPEPKTRLEALARAAGAAETDADALGEVLDNVGAAIDEGGDDVADLELLRGRIHRALGNLDEALAAFERAVDAGASPSTATYSMGLAYAELDQTDKAIEAWQKVADADPGEIDALYNIGLAHYSAGDFEPALAAWTEAFSRLRETSDRPQGDPGAVRPRPVPRRRQDPRSTARHLAQRQRPRGSAGGRVRVRPVRRRRRRGPRLRDASAPGSELVHDLHLRVEHVGGGDDGAHGHEHPTHKISVQVETSDYARQRGVPYVISVIGKKGYKALGTAEKLPPYPELKATVEQLIRKELGAPPAPEAVDPGADDPGESE